MSTEGLAVRWEDGLYLMPHHFQQEARAVRYAMGGLCRSLAGDLPAWQRLQVDWDGLPWGRVALGPSEAVWHDGLCLRWPLEIEGPGQLTLPVPDQAAGALWLGVEIEADDCAVHWAEISDASKTLEPIQMALLKRKAKWIQSGTAEGLGRVLCVGRLLSDGSVWRPDPAYCPPMLHLSGAHLVRLKVQALLDGVADSIGQLQQRQAADQVVRSSTALADLPDRLWASLLAGFHARATTLLASPAATVRQCADLLAQTAAEWQAARGLAHVQAFEPWRPEDPMSGISARLMACQAALGSLETQGLRHFAFRVCAEGGWTVQVDPACLQAPWDIFLAVQSDSLDPSWIASVPGRVKLGAPHDIRQRLHSALPGVPLIPVTAVPVQLSVRRGRHYFALDRRSPLFTNIAEDGVVSLFCPTEMEGLDIELVCILRSLA